MRRIFAFILTLAMLLSIGVSASAINIGDGGTDVAEVKVEVIDGDSETPTKYYVTVTWEDLTFTYKEGKTTKDWDPENHRYTDSSGDGNWEDTSSDIVVTNHSNVAINVVMSFDGSGATKTVHGVTATLTNHTFSLATGEGRTFADADKAATTVTVSNTPEVDSDFSIGMVKINIS